MKIKKIARIIRVVHSLVVLISFILFNRYSLEPILTLRFLYSLKTVQLPKTQFGRYKNEKCVFPLIPRKAQTLNRKSNFVGFLR